MVKNILATFLAIFSIYLSALAQSGTNQASTSNTAAPQPQANPTLALGVDTPAIAPAAPTPAAPRLSTTARPDPSLIIYDFKTKLLYHSEAKPENVINNINKISVNPNTRVTFKVININRYLYDIGFSADDNEFGSEPPALFNQLFLGQGGFVEGLLQNLNKSMNLMTDSQTSPPDFQEFTTALVEFMSVYNSLVEKRLTAFSACPGDLPACGTDIEDKVTYMELTESLLTLKVAYHANSSVLTASIAQLSTKIAAAQKAFDECQKKTEDLTTELKAETTPSKRAKIETEIKNLKCQEKEKELTDLKETKKLQESLKSDSEKLWEIFSKITDEDLMKLVLFQNNLVQEHFSYTSPPIFPAGNYLTIGLGITPSDSSLAKKWNIMPLAADSFGVSLFVKGKTYVSFSSGPFLLLGGSVRHHTFGWEPQPDQDGVISDSSQYKLVPTGKGSQPIGLSAFANLGIQVTRGIGIGLSPGVGITIEEKPRPAYLFGLSLLLGEQRQFNVTAGGLLTYADRLKSGLYPDMGNRLYASKPPTIEFNRELKKGGFIALSYTFHTLHKTRSTKSK